MILKVHSQSVITLQSDQGTPQTIRAILHLLSGLIICFISIFFFVFGQAVLGALLIVLGIFLALLAIPPLLKSEALTLYRNGSRWIEVSSTRYFIFPVVRQWEMQFVSSVEGQLITGENEAGQINILLNFTNGSSEVVLSEPREVIPIKCLNYVNQFIEGKRIPEGEFRD